MSEAQSSENTTTTIKDLPDDILILIFSELDIKSLINCMEVNYRWREIVEYCCHHFDMWDKVIEEVIDYSGLKFKEKSTLEGRDLFACAQKWSNIKNAVVYYDHNFNAICVKKICIYKDNFMLITNGSVEYYNMNTYACSVTNRVPLKCLKYEESYAFRAEIAIPFGRPEETNLLVLINKVHKSHCTCTKGQKMILCKMYLIKLHLNHCYVVDNKNVLRVFKVTQCKWEETVLARYYGILGSIIEINIHKDDIYIMLQRGDILRLDKETKKFEKIFQFDMSILRIGTKSFTFHAFSQILAVPRDSKMEVIPLNTQNQIVLICPGLKFALEHGPVVFMVYDDMKIKIYMTKKLLENKAAPEPELCIDMSTYLKRYELEKVIKSLDVYENTDGHHLFVVTNTYVHELILT